MDGNYGGYRTVATFCFRIMRKIGAFIWYQKLPFDRWIQKWSGHTPLRHKYYNSCAILSIPIFISQKSSSKSNENNNTSDEVTVCNVQYLYIQMEFCDGGTLRHAIDKELYKDQRRVWRYFREIVEGLVHVHSQVIYIGVIYTTMFLQKRLYPHFLLPNSALLIS